MADNAPGAVLMVTADTMGLLGCAYLNYGRAALHCPSSKYYYSAFDAAVTGMESIVTKLLAFDTSVIGVGAIGTNFLLLGSASGAGNVKRYATASVATAPAASAAIITQNRQSALISAVRDVFADAKISVSSHSDQEEGWTRPLIEVDTGITDPDELSALEYKFFQYVENHETLKAALDTTTVLFE